ncbi:MAG: VWA domain-containing protein, partial [Pirellulales bacterium]|nr:VWA domain-containing protein [Pirellulales bacterium]
SAAPPADLTPPIDLAGILKAMESTPAPNSGTGLAGETNLEGDAFDADRGSGSSTEFGQTTTSVFGVSGSGSRFVYVFDRSDSMNGYDGKPLRAAKGELLRSLQSLSEKQRFQIVFYNDKPTPFQLTGVPLQLIAGEASLRSRAERYVDSVTAFGGTEHAAALKLALRMSPDVIFFLTDARIPRLSGSELREIQRRADQVGASIHAIEFGAEPAAPADSFLRDLAAMNNGQYQYIDVRSLNRRAAVPDRPAEDAP